MNIKAPLKYQLRDYFKSIFYFYLWLVLIVSLLVISSAAASSDGYVFMTHELMSAVYVLVLGLCGHREYFHIFTQSGISRKTFFVSRLAAMLIAALALTFIDQILYITAFFISQHLPHYQAVSFAHGSFVGDAFSFSLFGAISYFFALIAVYSFGSFLNLIYYRLEKMGKVIFSLCAPFLFSAILPFLDYSFFGSRLSRLVSNIISFVSSGPLPAMAVFSLLAAVFLAGSWILTRRAPVKI